MLLFPVVQSALQPSPSKVLPSSHCSVPAVTLSPQTVWQRLLFSWKPVAQASQTELESGQETQAVTVQETKSQVPVVAFTMRPIWH